MSIFKKLFKQTAIYGLATVLPRALGIVLVPLYTSVLGKDQYGVYAAIMAFLILGNVLLSYGMETAFFRFINKKEFNKKDVQATALTSITVTTLLFLLVTLPFRNKIAVFLDFNPLFITYGLFILALDALAIIPFVWFRANEKPEKFAFIKIFNVCINLGLNLFFFLLLPKLVQEHPQSIWNNFYVNENKVIYVFIANLMASAITLFILIPSYIKIGFRFKIKLWKKMLKYAFPVLIAGIAFSINEAFDKILLKYLLPADIADAEVGVYAACYKLGVFMTLFATAFRLGIEPFFFNHAQNKNAKETYAIITQYFVILGSIILLAVVVYIPYLKKILIPNPEYWSALTIVPIILLANLCLGIYHNLSVWYKITDRTHFGAFISVMGAGITLILNFILIPIMSYKGSAIATLAAYGSMMVVSYIYGQKNYAVPYNIKKIGAYLAVAILLAYLSFYVFSNNSLIGTCFLFLYIALIFVSEKNNLQKILRT